MNAEASSQERVGNKRHKNTGMPDHIESLERRYLLSSIAGSGIVSTAGPQEAMLQRLVKDRAAEQLHQPRSPTRQALGEQRHASDRQVQRAGFFFCRLERERANRLG